MSNFEKEDVEESGLGTEPIGPDKLTPDDIARLLGASVVIPVSCPLEALKIYQQRLSAIRNHTQDETEE